MLGIITSACHCLPLTADACDCLGAGPETNGERLDRLLEAAQLGKEGRAGLVLYARDGSGCLYDVRTKPWMSRSMEGPISCMLQMTKLVPAGGLAMPLHEASQEDGCVKAIVTADSFKITFVSAAFESAYGLAQSQVVGRSLAVIHGPCTDTCLWNRLMTGASNGWSQGAPLITLTAQGRLVSTMIETRPVLNCESTISHVLVAFCLQDEWHQPTPWPSSVFEPSIPLSSATATREGIYCTLDRGARNVPAHLAVAHCADVWRREMPEAQYPGQQRANLEYHHERPQLAYAGCAVKTAAQPIYPHLPGCVTASDWPLSEDVAGGGLLLGGFESKQADRGWGHTWLDATAGSQAPFEDVAQMCFRSGPHDAVDEHLPHHQESHHPPHQQWQQRALPVHAHLRPQQVLSGASPPSTFIVPRRNFRSAAHDKALPVRLTLDILSELSVLSLVQASQVVCERQ